MAEKKICTEKLEIEDALARLEEVAKMLSGEGVSLEDSLALYAEGVELVNHCSKRLDTAERKIKALRTSPDGEVSEEIFDAEPI